jgi:hypothetical protein
VGTVKVTYIQAAVVIDIAGKAAIVLTIDKALGMNSNGVGGVWQGGSQHSDNREREDCEFRVDG